MQEMDYNYEGEFLEFLEASTSAADEGEAKAVRIFRRDASQQSNSTDDATSLLLNSTGLEEKSTESNTSSSSSSASSDLIPFDVRKFIAVRANDWRDDHSRQIIWFDFLKHRRIDDVRSIESRHHPDYGRIYMGVGDQADRVSRSSRLMSFAILGSVIGFILYTYLSHVLLMRKLRREIEQERLRELVKCRRSAFIMATSADPAVAMVEERGERRHSILNLFRGFRL